MPPRTRKTKTDPTPEETPVTETTAPEDAAEETADAPKRGRKADPATAVLRDLRKAQTALQRVENLISGYDELTEKRDVLTAEVDALKTRLAELLG